MKNLAERENNKVRKKYVKPSIEIVELRVEERISACNLPGVVENANCDAGQGSSISFS